ncbi:MAG: hypothetical protein JWN78_1606 [Bacteroidota bacterium]|nr:hypothetical protein [Bacteroidota bacterium]
MNFINLSHKEKYNLILTIIFILASSSLFASKLTSVRYTLPSKVEYCINDTFFIKIKNITHSKLANVNLYNVFSIYKNRYDSSIAPISYTGNTLGQPATISNKGHVTIFLKDTLYAGETIEIGIIGKLNCVGYHSYYDTSALTNIIQVSYKSGNTLKMDQTITTIYNPQIPVLVISNVTPSTQDVILFQPYFIDVDVVNGGFGDLSAFVLKLNYNKPEFQTKIDSIAGSMGILIRNTDTTASIYVGENVFRQQLGSPTMKTRQRITLRIYLHNQTCNYTGIMKSNISGYLICPDDTFSFCDTTRSPKDFFINYQAKPKNITVVRDTRDRSCIISGTNNFKRDIVIRNDEAVPLDSIYFTINSGYATGGEILYTALDTSSFLMRYNNNAFQKPAIWGILKTDTSLYRPFDLSRYDTLPPVTRDYLIEYFTNVNNNLVRNLGVYESCYGDTKQIYEARVRLPNGMQLQPGDSIAIHYESRMCDQIDNYCNLYKYVNYNNYTISYYEPCIKQYLLPIVSNEHDLDNYEVYEQPPHIILIGNLAEYCLSSYYYIFDAWMYLQKMRQDEPVRHYSDSVYYQNSVYTIEMRLSNMLDFSNTLPVIYSRIWGTQWPADYKTMTVQGNEKVYTFYWKYNGAKIDSIFTYNPNLSVSAGINFPCVHADCSIQDDGHQYMTRTDGFFVQPVDGCAPLPMPLSICSSNIKVDVYCPQPGCAYPFMSITEAHLERINLGLKDSNNDGIPDDSVTVASKFEVLNLNTYIAGDTMLAKHLMVPVNIAAGNTAFKNAYSYIQFSEAAPANYWSSAGGKIEFYDKNTNTHYKCNITSAQVNLDTAQRRWYINCSPKAYAAQFPVLANFYFKEGDSVNVYPLFRFDVNLEGGFLDNELYLIHTYLSDSALDFKTLSVADNKPDLIANHIYRCSFTFNYLNLMGYSMAANFYELGGNNNIDDVKYCNDKSTLTSSFEFGMLHYSTVFFFGNEVRQLVRPKKETFILPRKTGYVATSVWIYIAGENTANANITIDATHGKFTQASTLGIIHNTNDSTVEVDINALCDYFHVNTYQLGEYNTMYIRFTVQPVCNKPIHFDMYSFKDIDIVRSQLFLDNKEDISGSNYGDTLFTNYAQYHAFTGDTVVQYYNAFPDKIYDYKTLPRFLFGLLVYNAQLDYYDSIYGGHNAYAHFNRFISAALGSIEATDNPNPAGLNRVSWDFQVRANTLTNPIYSNNYYIDTNATAYNPYLIIQNSSAFTNIKVVRQYGNFDTILGPIYKLDTTGIGFRDPEKYPFRIIADVKSCSDSMQVLLGFNCTEYPTTLDDTLICNKQSLILYTNFNAATLQTAFVTQPDTIRLCDTATVEFKVTSSNLDNVLSILNTLVLPSGFSVVPHTSMVKFPDSSQYVPTLDPQHIPGTTKYIYYIDSVIPGIKNSGLFGYNYIFNHLDALDSNLYSIRFTIVAECNNNTLQSGYKMSLTINGQSACGKPTKSVRIYSDALYISGAQKLYDADIDIPRAQIKVCTHDITTSIVSFINIGPLATGSNDSLSIILPAGVILVDSAIALYNPTTQHLGQYHVTVTNDGVAVKYTIKLPTGITEADSLIFAIHLMASSTLNCGELPLQIETFNKTQVRCYIDGSLCAANQNTGNVEALIDITKPSLVIQDFDVIHIAKGVTKDTITFRAIILNIGDSVLPASSISFSLYGDVNGTHILENGIDVFIDTLLFKSGLNTGTAITLMKKVVVDKNVFCSFVLAQDTTCACGLPQANTILLLPVQNAGNDVITCSNRTITIGSPQLPGFTYSWSPGAFLLTPNAPQTQLIPINHKHKIDTLQYVLTTQTNTSICIYIDTVTVIVYPKIDTIINKTICSGDSIIIGGIVYKTAGVYVQNLTSVFGCDSIVRTNLSLTTNCVCPTINASISDTFFCSKNVSASAVITDYTSVQWSLTSDFTQIISNTISLSAIQNNAAQTYYLRVENAGCIKIDSITLYNNTITFTNNDKIICDTSLVNINLQVNSSTGYTVQWNIGDSLFQTSNTSQINYLAMHSQTAHFTITNNKGCTVTDSFNIMMNEIPVADITASQVLVTPNTTVQLQTPFNNTYVYAWTPISSVSNPNIYNPATQLTQNTWYYVNVTDRNNCENADSILIRIQQTDCDAQFFIPNAFSPNGDGVNDIFKVRYPCELEDFYLIIYDRWGLKVFESHDINIGWNGEFNGDREQVDVYAFYVAYMPVGSTKKIVKGNVTLLE